MSTFQYRVAKTAPTDQNETTDQTGTANTADTAQADNAATGLVHSFTENVFRAVAAVFTVLVMLVALSIKQCRYRNR